MNTANYTTIKAQIDKHGFAIKKKFGQNFLIDQNMVDKIVKGAQITADDVVIEVGPGLGSLTTTLAQHCQQVICVEIDTQVIPILEEMAPENVTIVQGDILKLDIEALIAPYESVKVVANLPYYIAAPIVTRFLETKVKSLTMMMQKEVADRMRAPHRTKDYGSLTLFVNYHAQVSLVTQVARTCFLPRPNVDSTVLHFKLEKKYHPKDEELFLKLIRAAFSQRRKTMVNSLEKEMGLDKRQIGELLQGLGLSEKARAEELDMMHYVALSDNISKAMKL